MSNLGHTGALFLTYPIPLERSWRYDSITPWKSAKRGCNELGVLFGVNLGLIATLFGVFQM